MDDPNDVAAASIASVLEQLATMRVESVSFSPRAEEGQLARVKVAGGTHEILCELGDDGRVLSARVIEL